MLQSLYTHVYENLMQFFVDLTAILHQSNPVKENYHQTQTKDKSTTSKSYQLIYKVINNVVKSFILQ